MEVAGCPTVCRHCWAQGTGYGMIPLADIEWVLAEAHRFCDGRGVGFDCYPMHELAAHPDAARLFGLFNSHSRSASAPRTGARLRVRAATPWTCAQRRGRGSLRSAWAGLRLLQSPPGERKSWG